MPEPAEIPRQIDPEADDRGFVIRVCGVIAAGTIPLILVLSFIDAVMRHVAWEPDEKVLAACLAQGVALSAYAWRTRK